jgi:hypothetical protein
MALIIGARHARHRGRAFLHKRARNSEFPARSHSAMLAAMTDVEALEALRSAIRTLFADGAARERWRTWADRIQDEEFRDLDGPIPGGGGTIRCMPIDLTAAELETAARACRAMAYQEGERAKQIENPGMRGPVENAAQRYATLAERFEAAHKRV